MLKQKNKKILLYLFLFLFIGTLNNKNFNNFNFAIITEINVNGLDTNENLKLLDNLNFLKISNLFFLNNLKVKEVMNSNNLVEKYSVFKNYPSTLNIEIHKTKFLAKLQKDKKNYYIGSNGKLLKATDLKQNLPFIFGDFQNKNFFELKEAIDQTSFSYNEVKKLFFFKSGRWDIETKNGLLIKLPKDNIKKSLELFINFLNENSKIKITEIDLRQLNQIIINE